jgi:hypothetical protein
MQQFLQYEKLRLRSADQVGVGEVLSNVSSQDFFERISMANAAHCTAAEAASS